MTRIAEIDDDLDDADGDQEKRVLYSVDDTPPWHLCILLGFQHYLTAIGGIISIPLVLAQYFCMDKDTLGISEVIGTIIFVSGLSTILQTTFGIRLPIVQGSTPTFLIPTIAIMSQPVWKCEYKIAREMNGSHVNFTAYGLPEPGSEGHQEIWMKRIREIQGAIMVASIFQVVIGFSGVMTFALRFIGPLSIVPIVALTGFSLFPVGSDLASGQWWIALMTTFLVIVFSQYLKNIKIPICRVDKKHGCVKTDLAFFNIFPVLLAMIISCIVCTILTVTDVLPDHPDEWGYAARIDTNLFVMKEAKWFRFPYPGQWGIPTVSVAGVFGMLAGVLAAMLESVGDYYACARLAGAPPPPSHAVNRGIFIEGIACILAGAWGSGNGTTSFSENIGVIGITKVGSRRVVQVGGIIMIVLGCFGKFSALFTLIPTPVFGGLFMVTFGMVAAVGLSNLQYIDLNSPRNLCILGVSLFFGVSLPLWLQGNDAIHTGSDVFDQILSVLLGTSMFVGGMIGFVLDNTIPGTDRERGIRTWREDTIGRCKTDSTGNESVYNPPFFQDNIFKNKVLKYLPICPPFLNIRNVSDISIATSVNVTDVYDYKDSHKNSTKF
ncbi:solute carrier family 23 member 2-like [Ruditapes philippinarum]|uniref:solute carrier family 23 member 2-like n=1 Tax=Ruditapes philippinarum TaxID=129788 RepID=UPI00295BD260|nr:solute carrier family 23 member 2-like [Ruditapes philippinarum]